MFISFVPTCAITFRKTHGKNKAYKCDIEDFVHFASLSGVVRSPSSFVNSFIGNMVKYYLPYTLT